MTIILIILLMIHNIIENIKKILVEYILYLYLLSIDIWSKKNIKVILEFGKSVVYNLFLEKEHIHPSTSIHIQVYIASINSPY